MPRCSGSYAVEETVLAYNTRYQRKWKFQGLHSFVKGLPTADRRELLERTIPAMARLALRLPDVCPESIALLQCGVAGAFHIRITSSANPWPLPRSRTSFSASPFFLASLIGNRKKRSPVEKVACLGQHNLDSTVEVVPRRPPRPLVGHEKSLRLLSLSSVNQ
jgi:hypothetical protein